MNLRYLQLIPTTTPAYTYGDCIGSLTGMAIGGAMNPHSDLRLSMLRVIDRAMVQGAIRVMLFSERPVNTTFTDNGVLTINAQDMHKTLAVVDVAAADYVPENASAFSRAEKRNLDIPVCLMSSTNALFMAVESGHNNSYSLANNLSLEFVFSNK